MQGVLEYKQVSQPSQPYAKLTKGANARFVAGLSQVTGDSANHRLHSPIIRAPPVLSPRGRYR